MRPWPLEQVAALIDGLGAMGDGAEPGAYRARLAEVVPEFKSTAGEVDARLAAEVVPLRRNG